MRKISGYQHGTYYVCAERGQLGLAHRSSGSARLLRLIVSASRFVCYVCISGRAVAHNFCDLVLPPGALWASAIPLDFDRSDVLVFSRHRCCRGALFLSSSCTQRKCAIHSDAIPYVPWRMQFRRVHPNLHCNEEPRGFPGRKGIVSFSGHENAFLLRADEVGCFQDFRFQAFLLSLIRQIFQQGQHRGFFLLSGAELGWLIRRTDD